VQEILKQEHLNQLINTMIQKFLVTDNAEIINSPLAKLSMQELKIIVYLGTFGSDTMSSVAKNLGIPHSTLTNIADRLEKQVYIGRKQSTQDRRSYMLFLTQSGKDLFSLEEKKYFPLSQAMLNALTESEQDILIVLLSKIVQS